MTSTNVRTKIEKGKIFEDNQEVCPVSSLSKNTELTMLNKGVIDIFKKVSSGEDVRLVNLDIVRDNFRKLRQAFSHAIPFIAVKANSSEGILETLDKEGSSYEVATIEELKSCLDKGIDPHKILFSHPAKDRVEIAEAYRLGVNKYVSDSEEDLGLIAQHAPGSEVLVRLRTANTDKDGDSLTGFNDRFGVNAEQAKFMLGEASRMGLSASGLAFHVGTQQENVDSWDATIKMSADIFKEMSQKGMSLKYLDIGGGFPSRYKPGLPEYAEYGEAIHASLREHFKDDLPKILYEPGRSVSATAGLTVGRVINVKHNFERAIVTLSTGRFSAGLFNVGNGMAFYRLSEDGDVTNLSKDKPHVLADVYGKACASFDTPVEGDDVSVPENLKSGDIVVFSGTGAYSGEMVTNWCSKEPPRTITYDTNDIA